MMGALLWRGMLVGVLAGLACFVFLRLVGETPVEAAIAFESHHETAATPAGAHAHAGAATPLDEAPELVSRQTQAGLGLLVAVTVYGAAFGGLFAVAFTLAYGRMAELSPRATAAVLAVLGFVTVYLVPLLKYPPNPPAVGAAETIGVRTALYFGMIALSLAAAIGAGMLRLRLLPRLGAWNACLVAGAAYLIVIGLVGGALPTVNEVPGHFPAAILWDFRLATLGTHALLYVVVGIGFGLLAEPILTGASLASGILSRPSGRIAP
jgi:hypothetical protein